MASALTHYSTTDAEVRKAWAKKLYYEVMQRTEIFNPSNGMCSEKSTSLCQEYSDLSKDKGDKITVTLIRQLSGAGVMGTDNLAGREEGLESDTDALTINKQRHGVGTNGEITDQRVTWDTMEEAKEKLADWWAARLECSAATQLCGFTAAGSPTYLNAGGDQIDGSDLRYTGLNAPVDPQSVSDTNHQLWADSSVTEDESLAPGDEIDVGVIDRCVTKSKMMPFPIRPMRVKGSSYYTCWLSPLQVRDLRASSSDWYSLMTNALQGGRVDDNPLFTGALGVYSNVIFREWFWISHGINSATGAAAPNTRRAVFAGAQSLAVAYGKGYGKSRMRWTNEEEDHGDKYYAGSGMIWGLKATRFNQEDFGKIVISSYSPDAI